MSSHLSNNEKIIENIQKLQNMEKQLYSNLETLPHTTNSIEKSKIVDKINMMSDSRIHLYQTLLSTHGLIKNTVTSEKEDVKDKMQLITTYEKQLDEMKNEMNNQKNLNINNLRLTEINTYYSQKYNAYFSLFKMIALFCIILIVVIFLRQRYIISPRIANVLAIIIIIGGSIYTIPKIFDLSARNNLVFDEYDFQLKPGTQGTTTNSNGSGISLMELGLENIDEKSKKYAEDLKLIASGDCVGPHCCTASGLKYDDKTNSCILEGFVSNKGEPLIGAPLNDNSTITKQLVMKRNPNYYSINH